VTAAAVSSSRASTRRTLTSAALALVVVTAIWGSTFALSKDLITRISVTDYLGLRFLTAAVAVAVARPRQVLRIDRRVACIGAGLGLCYFLGQALQFFGLEHTAATVSAFVVSMYVVFAPLLGAVVLRVRPSIVTVLATVLATVGIATMSLRGWTIGHGELLTLVAAGMYAVHILALGRWSTPATAYPLTFVQLLTMGVCFVVWASLDGLRGPSRADLPTFLYLALVAGAVAMLVQTWAQAHLSSAQVAVLMVLEPVWAAFFGFALWHEALGARTLIGGGLVLVAMLLVVSRPSGSRAASMGAAEAAGLGAIAP
jgi:drug/metabolite transporter (DMT)-like permease